MALDSYNFDLAPTGPSSKEVTMTTETRSGFQDASDMLAEALKQMDGLLAGTIKRDSSSPSSSGSHHHNSQQSSHQYHPHPQGSLSLNNHHHHHHGGPQQQHQQAPYSHHSRGASPPNGLLALERCFTTSTSTSSLSCPSSSSSSSSASAAATAGGIPNSTSNSSNSPKFDSSLSAPRHAVRLLNDLRLTLESSRHDQQGQIFRQLSTDTQNFLREWLERCCGVHSLPLSNGYSPSSGTATTPDGADGASLQRLRKLETERDDLMLQVSVLGDQIDAQLDKIQELERTLRLYNGNHGNNNLATTGGTTTGLSNGNLYGGGGTLELLNRNHGNGNSDTHKLDLMAENSNLKLRLAAIDREKAEVELRLNYAQKCQEDLQGRLNTQTVEISDLKSRCGNSISSRNNNGTSSSAATTPSSPESIDMSPHLDRTTEREKTLDRLKRKHTEVERLKKAVESLMIKNSEKDHHIDELKRQMKRFRRVEELLAAQGRLVAGQEALLGELGEDHSDGGSTPASHVSGGVTNDLARHTVAEKYDFTDNFHTRSSDNGGAPSGRPDLRVPPHLQPTATSTPVNAFDLGSPKSRDRLTNGNQAATPISAISKTNTGSSPKHATNAVIGRSSSYEDIKTKPTTSASSSQQKGTHIYGGTLPKDARLLPQVPLSPPYSPLDSYESNTTKLTTQLSDSGVVYQSRPRASTLPKGKPPKAPGSGTLTPKGSFRSSSARASMRSHHGSSDTSSSANNDSANQQQQEKRNSQSELSQDAPPAYGSLSSGHQKGAVSSNKSPASASSSSSHGHPRKQRRFMSFGKGIFKGKSGKWSSSAPNLAQTETDEEALKDEMAQQYKELQRQGTEQRQRKHKGKGGIKRFFGKLRRSNSQDLDQDKVGDFKRSGLRATAGPRLGWSRDMKYTDLDVPFTRWDSDRIASWLHNIGLSMYVGDCKRWVKNGSHLINATSQELEKELGMRNYFHRKKLQLALTAVESEKKSPMDDLDHNWVTRWMDDIGLPQYKDQFAEARVDGRMLHYLSVEDLVALKVTNVLHHLSVKRAIQVLRLCDFNGSCLKRRPLPDEANPTNSPGEVMLWTNHRVMEWLRSIDLSEYAPNLRGSGVHGGLMVLEPRYGAEVFASLLSIPSNKTLLRRHLSTHFVALIGSEVQHKKREIESQPGFMPLTPSQKVKLKKRLFSHKRTRSTDTQDEDLICPLGGSRQSTGSSSNGSHGNGHVNGSPSWNREGSVRGQEENQNMLAQDRFLDEVPTSDV